MKLKKLLLALSMAGALAASSAFAASVLTLDPQGNNTGCTNLAGSGCGQMDPATPAFNTDNSHLAFTSLLNVAASAGATTYTETGNFRLTDATLLGVLQASGLPRPTGNYNIYAGFNLTGSGTWVTPVNFVIGSVGTFSLILYANPAGAANVGLGNGITLGSLTAAGQGITQDTTGGTGLADFVLGNAPFNAVTGLSGATKVGLSSGGAGTTVLQASLGFVPATGTSSPSTADGFFAAPIPFTILIGSSSSSSDTATTWIDNGTGGVLFRTLDGNGGGNISYTTLKVPEPSALALIGLAFAGMGFLGYRRRSDG